MTSGVGLSIALMGIDGAGKSTLVAELRRVFGAEGREVVPVTWEAAVAAAGDRAAYPAATLEMLGIEGWRLMYAAPDHPGRTYYEDIPRWIAEEGPRGMIAKLPTDPVGGHQAALVTSALLEMVGHQLVQAEVVQPALARGAVTLCDGFGYKNVVKVLRMAQLMPGGAFPAATLDMLLDCALRTFGDPFMQPAIGLLLDADAALTYQWRMSQEARLGPAEDLSLAGRPGRESYLDFQAALAKEYRAAAEAWGWHVLPVDGRPQSETVAAALDAVLAGPTADRDRHTGASATR